MAEPMTQMEAKAACARLAETHPDRATHQWLPRHVAVGWQVVKVGIPPPADPLHAETRVDERPSTGEDPRTAQVRNTGPYAGT